MNRDAQMIGILVGACIAGIVCGLLPLIVGIVRKRIVLGIAGFACTVVAGMILGLILAIPSAIVWTVIIFAVGPGDAAERERRRRREYEDEYEDSSYEERYSDRDFLPPKRDQDQPPDDRYRSTDDRFRGTGTPNFSGGDGVV